jgi:hypothetical protein
MAFERALALQYTGALTVPPRALSEAVLKWQQDLLYEITLEAAGGG